MRKKYLSALLFGALLFASAGTFTSCKDYDDDIDGLRTEITDLKSAVTELQNAVQNGKYVTAVSGNGNVITFTFSDGSTTPITIETESGEPSQTVTIGEDGEVIINGEGTGYYTTKTPSEAEVEAGLVKKGANGTWEVLGEDGEYTDTKIPVSGISVSGSDAEGYTFTVVNANGETQTVKLPSVASAITNIDFKNGTEDIVTNTRTDGTTLVKTDGITAVNASSDVNNFTFSQTIFDYDNFPTDFKASDWKGNKALPADESVILSSESSIDVRIDPVGADATLVSYTLTNTKNQDASGLTLKAVAESGEDPLTTGQVQGRAGNLGNGLYTLSMDNKVLTKDEAKSILDNGLEKIDAQTAYAVNAAHAARSKYALNIIEAQAPKLTKLTFTQGNNTLTTNSLADQAILTPTIKVGQPVQVAGLYDKAVYDIYLEVADENAKFNVTFDQDKHTFTIGQNPDWATRDVTIPIIVWTAATDGTITKTTVTVKLDSEYNTASDYQPVTHNIAVTNPNDNVEYFDLQTMKDGFQSQDDLDSWIKNVNLSGTSYEVFTDEACSANKKVVNISKLDFDIVSEKKTDTSVEQTGEKGASANFVRMMVNNAVSDGLTLDKQYYVKVTFRDGGTNTSTNDIFNSIVIPVTFTAPTVAEQFTISTNYQNGTANSIKAYYNVWESANGIDVNEIDLVTFFTKDGYDKYAKLTLDTDEKVAEYGSFSKLTSNDLAKLEVITSGNQVVGNTTIELNKTKTANNDLVLNDKTNREVGYGKALTITAENKNYANTEWAYPDKAEYTDYTFTVTVLSPIYEGVIAATDGSKNLTVIANSEVGTDITKDMINLTDYANNKYNVVPDASVPSGKTLTNSESNNADVWSHKQIENVWVDETGKNNYIKEIKLRGLNATDPDNIIPGAITVIAQPIAEFTEPTEVTVHVKDVWGYVTSQPLNMTLIKAE